MSPTPSEMLAEFDAGLSRLTERVERMEAREADTEALIREINQNTP